MKLKILFSAALILFCSFAIAGESLVDDFQKTKTTLLRQDYRQRKVMAALYEVNRRMRRLVKDKANLAGEVMALEPLIEKNSLKISELEQQTSQKRKQIRGRLATTYMMGNQGLLRTIFSAESAGDLDRTMKILGKITEKDFSMIKEYLELAEQLKAEKESLVGRTAHLKALSERLVVREAELIADQNSKGKLLSQIRKAKSKELQKLAAIRKKSEIVAEDEETREFYELLTRPSFFEQRGFLQPPLQASLIRGYGYIRNKERSVALAHKGHFYKATRGSAVQSVFSGKVAFLNEIEGFGSTVIIDHGDHYYTVYSNLSKVSVQKGDEVLSRQIIGESGWVKESGAPGLYFEVRHFSEATDPSSWFDKNKVMRVSSTQ